MATAEAPPLVIKMLGTVPPIRHELVRLPPNLDALDDIVLEAFHAALRGRPHRLLVDGRQAREEDLVESAGRSRTLVVHVQTVENVDCHTAAPEASAWQSAVSPTGLPVFPSPSLAVDLRAFDGSWRSDGVPIVINNGVVRWADQTETILEPCDEEAVVAMALDGRVFHGTLSMGGNSLQWDDGDAWFRTVPSGEVPEQASVGMESHDGSAGKLDAQAAVEPEIETEAEPESEAEAEPEAEAPADTDPEGEPACGELEVESALGEIREDHGARRPGFEPTAGDTVCAAIEEKTCVTRQWRGRRQMFRKFVLSNPFGDRRWCIRLVVASARSEDGGDCRQLLEQMARRVGALPDDALSAQDRQAVERLSRLEARFAGRGVHAGEAENALRLFERELVRAHWSKETFERLRRQLSGEQPSGAVDVPVELSVCWANPAPGLRRDVWFCTACERISKPLGLACGQSRNSAGWDGSCFVGPLGTAVGAALTAVLIFRLGHADYDRLSSEPAGRGHGPKPRSRHQFLQGFVDGCLDESRALVWDKLLSSSSASEAKQYAMEQRALGFFDSPPTQSSEKCAAEAGAFFSSLFSTRAIGNGQAGRETAATVARNVATMRRSRKFNERQSVSTYMWACRRSTALKVTTTGKCYEAGRAAGVKRRGDVSKCAQAKPAAGKRRLAIEGGA